MKKKLGDKVQMLDMCSVFFLKPFSQSFLKKRNPSQ